MGAGNVVVAVFGLWSIKLRAKPAKNAAFAHSAPIGAGFLKLLESFFKARQLLQPFPHVIQMASQQGIDFAAIRFRFLGQPDQLADLVLGHVQIATAFDKEEAVQMSIAVRTVATVVPVRFR